MMRTTQQKVREKNGENIDSNQMKLDAESEKTDIQMESNKRRSRYNEFKLIDYHKIGTK